MCDPVYGELSPKQQEVFFPLVKILSEQMALGVSDILPSHKLQGDLVAVGTLNERAIVREVNELFKLKQPLTSDDLGVSVTVKDLVEIILAKKVEVKKVKQVQQEYWP